MKTKKVKGKFEFDYPLDGLFFLPCERVQLLERKTGEQRTLTMCQIQDKVGGKDFKRIESKLQTTNLFTTPRYQIMGLADVDSKQAQTSL
jgi:hypothetical protein